MQRFACVARFYRAPAKAAGRHARGVELVRSYLRHGAHARRKDRRCRPAGIADLAEDVRRTLLALNAG